MEPLQQSTVGNLLLRYCEPDDFELLRPYLTRRTLPTHSVVVRPNQPIEHLYFPEGGVISIVAEQEDGDKIEVGLVGHEGVSGSAVLLDAGQSPQMCMVQINGAPALEIPADRLVEAFETSASLRKLLLRFVQALNVQAASTAAANAHLALPERLARWLLMCHDRVDGDQLELTHEFMSMMLAVRRSSVTMTLHTLEGTRAIRGTRGFVTVLDRGRLEEIAGCSYGEAEDEYRRLVGPFGKGRHGLKSVA
jgi:CRP-like cAMP-binding protein